MNYYAARQQKQSGKWHYTVENDGRIWPVGPCAEDCPGHDTADEACAHYRQGLLAKAVFRGPKTDRWPRNKCAVSGCEDEGLHLIDIPGTMRSWEVCWAHSNRETLEKLFPSVGESWSSY